MSSPLKDAAIAFGSIMAIISVWNFVEGQKAKKQSKNQISEIHRKLDLLLLRKK